MFFPTLASKLERVLINKVIVWFGMKLTYRALAVSRQSR